MPINEKKMEALKQEYGNKKGEDIYYAMEQKEKDKDINTDKDTKTKTDTKDIEKEKESKESDIEQDKENDKTDENDYKAMYHELKEKYDMSQRNSNNAKIYNKYGIDNKYHGTLNTMLKDDEKLESNIKELKKVFGASPNIKDSLESRESEKGKMTKEQLERKKTLQRDFY